MGDSTVTMTFTGWVMQEKTSLAMAKSEAIRLSIAAFDKAGIAMPEPTYRLIINPDSCLSGELTATPAPAPTQQDVAPVLSAAEMDDGADHALETLVNAERKELKGDDLLNREGAVQE